MYCSKRNETGSAIAFVMIAILVLNLVVNRMFKGRGSVDMSQGF